MGCRGYKDETKTVPCVLDEGHEGPHRNGAAEWPSGATEVVPGQLWTWRRPDGAWRTMLVERTHPGPHGRRAFGYNPQAMSSKRIQVQVVALLKRQHDACLLYTIRNFVHHPVRRY